MGPDRPQCPLDALRRVVETGGLCSVQLDPAQVLGADEPVLVRTDEPYWGTVIRGERPPVEGVDEEHVVGERVLQRDDRAIAVEPDEDDVPDARARRKRRLDDEPVDLGERDALPSAVRRPTSRPRSAGRPPPHDGACRRARAGTSETWRVSSPAISMVMPSGVSGAGGPHRFRTGENLARRAGRVEASPVRPPSIHTVPYIYGRVRMNVASTEGARPWPPPPAPPARAGFRRACERWHLGGRPRPGRTLGQGPRRVEGWLLLALP